jgi:hypothetical protein
LIEKDCSFKEQSIFDFNHTQPLPFSGILVNKTVTIKVTHIVITNQVAMKLPFYFFLFLLSSLALTSHAQKRYVHLNDGTILKGQLLYSENADILRIKSRGNIFAYHRNDIDTILTQSNREAAPLEFKNYFRTGITRLVGHSANEDKSPTAFQLSFNHHLLKGISAGIGGGMEYYKEATFIPAFANLEYRFRDTHFSPYVFTKAGYLFAADEKVPGGPVHYDMLSSFAPYQSEGLSPEGGFLINPGVGFTMMLGHNFGLGFGIGYRYHSISFKGDNDYQLEYQYNRLTFDLGILFK